MSAESLQEWAKAAQRSGSSMEKVTAFFEALASAKERALAGNKDALKLLSMFGANSGMRIEGIARAIAETFRTSVNSQDLIGPLRELGGKAATSLIPLFREGLEDVFEQVRQAGGILRDEVVAQLKEATDQALNLADALQGPVAEALAYLARQTTDFVDGLRQWVGGAAAFLGAKSGGASDAEAYKAMDDVVRGVDRERARRGNRSQREAPTRAPNLRNGVGPVDNRDWMGKLYNNIANASRDRTRIFDFTPSASGGSPLAGIPLTSNQQSGALVRFDPGANSLREVVRNTGRTASVLEEIKQRSAATKGSGLYSGQTESWE